MSGTRCPLAVFPTIPRARGDQWKPRNYSNATAAPGVPSAKKKSTTTAAATKSPTAWLPPDVKKPAEEFWRACALGRPDSDQHRRDRQARRPGFRTVRDASCFGKGLVHGRSLGRLHSKDPLFPFGR